MQATSYAVNGLQIYLSSLIKKRKRGVFDNAALNNLLLKADVTIDEHHTDQLEITDHPVDSGAQVSDHAFKLPSEVTIRMGWTLSASGSGDLAQAALGAAANLLPKSPALQAVAEAAAIAWGVAAIVQQNAITAMLGGRDQLSIMYDTLLSLQADRTPFTILTGKRQYNNMLIKTLDTVTDKDSENSLIVVMGCKQVIIVSTSTATIDSTSAQNPAATNQPVPTGQKQLAPSSSPTG